MKVDNPMVDNPVFYLHVGTKYTYIFGNSNNLRKLVKFWSDSIFRNFLFEVRFSIFIDEICCHMHVGSDTILDTIFSDTSMM